MKILSILLLIIGTTSANANNMSFSCSTPEGSHFDMDMDITAAISGKLSVVNGDLVSLNYEAQYKLGCNDEWSNGDECWSDTPVLYGKETNNLKYNPRTYKDHMQFDLDLSSDNSYGDYKFIFPKANLITDSKNFNAYLVMSWVNDHAGGTAQLKCQKTSEYKQPEGVSDTKECMAFVNSVKSYVNICGGDENFNAYSCRQSQPGANVICRAEAGWQSSFCAMSIEMNPTCSFNVSSKIISDQREDM